MNSLSTDTCFEEGSVLHRKLRIDYFVEDGVLLDARDVLLGREVNLLELVFRLLILEALELCFVFGIEILEQTCALVFVYRCNDIASEVDNFFDILTGDVKDETHA